MGLKSNCGYVYIWIWGSSSIALDAGREGRSGGASDGVAL
jgi:hypothetical protein